MNQETNAEATAASVPPDKGAKAFWVRLVTGIVYLAVLLGCFLLKVFVSDLFFDALILFFTFMGAYEMTRAFKEQIHLSQRVLVILFSMLIVAAYAVSDFVFLEILKWERSFAPHVTFVVFIAGTALLMGLLVFAHERVSLESTGYSLMSYLYPAVFLVVLTVCNHLESYSACALLCVFVMCPFVDSLAYVFGRCFGKKLPKKMAPTVSPKKTLIGGVGGLVGGAIAGIVVFFMSYGFSRLSGVDFSFDLDIDALGILFFVGLGVLVAAFSQFGDLVESAVKRKLGIKDMGKLLPGHGGILDRIDSSLYASLVICFVFVLRIMIAG